VSPGDFDNPLAEHVWRTKYCFREGRQVHDRTLPDTWRRVAQALAEVEPRDREAWQQRFYDILEDFRFLPGGRILAGAGTGRRVTLFNCFVMGPLEDSMHSIFERLKEGALTMQEGGGVGYDFSTLRPRGSEAHATGRIASGPVAFMHIWDAACAAILSTGARRGAMMASLRCDHPDIIDFIEAKRDGRALRHFNLSVQVSDAFMQAVERNEEWPLLFPAHALGLPEDEQCLLRDWPGEGEVACRVLRRVPARELWQRIMRGAYDYAEPGVLFVDRINRDNNLWYREHITTSNPCGEIPLPPYGACNLGSINLIRFVHKPFSAAASVDHAAIARTVEVAVRLLDNVIDVSHFPLPAQAQAAQQARRLGLGMTGLADALIMLGLHYAQAEARQQAASIMQTICHTAYRTSIALAQEKGSFPGFEPEPYLQGPFVAALPQDIREAIAAHGIRNSHLTAIAPAGTISLLAGNVSSGIEPVFDWRFERRLLDRDGNYRVFAAEDYAHALWRRECGDAALSPAFVTAQQIEPLAHLQMQAALQPLVDSAISKTVNVPADYPFEGFEDLYRQAHRLGLKGCTTFRPNPVTGEILSHAAGTSNRPCCDIEREAD